MNDLVSDLDELAERLGGHVAQGVNEDGFYFANLVRSDTREPVVGRSRSSQVHAQNALYNAMQLMSRNR